MFVSNLITVLNYLQEFASAENRTREQAKIEHEAVEIVPERGAMLEALRDEFPHINFTSK